MARIPTEPLVGGRLSCGCHVAFKAGVEGSPVMVVVVEKAGQCGMTLHVAGMPVFDHREALRPSTRHQPHPQPDYEEEG